MVAKPKLRYVSRKYIIAKAFGCCNQKIPEVYELKRMNGRNRKGGSMARGDSVTISFRLNLNREEDMEIWSFLTGDAIEPCFGDKSKFIKSALIRVVQGIKQDDSEKSLVCELNAQREVIQNAMSGEADRIINAVKLIVRDEMEKLAEVQTEKEKQMSYVTSETMPEKMGETSRSLEESPQNFDETVSEYAMSFLSDF